MNKNDVLIKLLECGVVAVIRMNDRQRVKDVIEAISLGGIKCVEITMTVPRAIEMIDEVRATMSSDIVLGAGTVTDKETAKAVIKAGAEFVVSPVLNPDIIAVCREQNVISIPGCYTPTEIFTGWSAGADVIKIFPARNLGPGYIKDITGPFPNIKMMPTGGVTIENAGEWIGAGAVAVGIGSELLDKTAIKEGRFEVLTERAKTLVKNVYQARSSSVK